MLHFSTNFFFTKLLIPFKQRLAIYKGKLSEKSVVPKWAPYNIASPPPPGCTYAAEKFRNTFQTKIKFVDTKLV